MDLYSAPTYSFDRDTCRMQIAIGSTLYPTNPIRSCAEQYSQLVKAVGGLQEAVGLSIGANYRSTCHIAAIDLEKSPAPRRRGARQPSPGSRPRILATYGSCTRM